MADTLAPEELDALLEQLRTKATATDLGDPYYVTFDDDDDWPEGVGNPTPDPEPAEDIERRLGFTPTPAEVGEKGPPERRWQTPDFTEPDDTHPADSAGVTALARLFELLERHRPAWQADALCIEYADTVTWFPEKGQTTAEAKATCSRCLVADECKRYAVENEIRHGVWGGESMSTRKRRSAA